MSLINYASKEITLKIVYYGPGLSGKTTNLQYLHTSIDQSRRGKLLSLATETDRTLFFDFMPMTLGKIGEFTIKFQMYTVPGQVRYNATRKLVLKGVDAVVFVADSQTALRDQNIESYENMIENLTANGLDPNDIPIVIQYNKRDLDDIMSLNILNRDLNSAGHKTTTAEAVNGTGVEETFQLVTQLLLKHFAQKHRVGVTKPAPAKEAPPAPPTVTEKPAYVPPPPPPTPPTPPPVEKVEEVREEPPVAAPKPYPKPTPEPQPVAGTSEPVYEIPEPEEAEAEIAEAVAGVTSFKLPKLGETSESMRAPEPEPEPEISYDEEAFAHRDMPSIDEISSVVEPGVQPGAIVDSDMAEALKRITAVIEQSRVEEWLEKILYSQDANKQTLSDVLAELKSSRKNHEKMIDLLQNIHSALKSSGKTTKRSKD